MKKLPTAPTVPSTIFQVWLRMAPPLDAMVPALGRLCGAAGAGASEVAACPAGGAVRLPISR